MDYGWQRMMMMMMTTTTFLTIVWLQLCGSNGCDAIIGFFAILSSWHIVEHTRRYTHIWFMSYSLLDISSAVVINSAWLLQYINVVCCCVISYRLRRLGAPDSLSHSRISSAWYWNSTVFPIAKSELRSIQSALWSFILNRNVFGVITMP